MKTLHYDAVIVGASLAGCICAIELAKKGWKVALLEKRVSVSAYKTLCTHILHPAFIKYLNELGLLDDLLLQSALKTNMKLIFDGMSAFYPLSGKQNAGNIERSDLDPAIRNYAHHISNIDLIMNEKVDRLRQSGKRITGVYTNNSQRLYLAPLIIGADGRNSQIANLAGAKTKILENGRIAIFCYFEHAELISTPDQTFSESHIWALDRGREYISIFPNKRHTLISWYLPDSEHKRILQNPELEIEKIVQFIEQNGITLGQRTSKIIISKDTSPLKHSTRQNNLVLIGDANLTADPLTGIGCTWALQSSQLLSVCLGKGDFAKSNNSIIRANLYTRLKCYKIIHWLSFGLLSKLMSFASMHGEYIFKKPIFRLLALITK